MLAERTYESRSGADACAEQDASEARQRRMDTILAQTTLFINVLLLVAKIVAAVLSNSLSVVSTVIDSAVDITSGAVIWYWKSKLTHTLTLPRITVRAIENHNPYDYPRGRTKLEPLAVVIVSIIMGVANIVMIIQSVQSVLDNKVKPEVDIATITILLTGTAIKVVLLVICLRQKSSGSKVLAMDQRNDIITNLVALSCGLIGTYVWIFADPIGAVLVWCVCPASSILTHSHTHFQ
jgi:divalent metal cation (Fe/Co/Zn/Cd) transporter